MFFVRRLYQYLVTICILTTLCGCTTPYVVLSVGCGGVVTSATEIATAAHCFADGNYTNVRTPFGMTAIATVSQIDFQNDTATLMLDRPVWLPYYGRFQAPAPGLEAFSLGLCPYRLQSTYRVVYAGQVNVTNAPPPIRQGQWDYWALLGNDVACGGDSGFPYFALQPNDDGTWNYYGTTSMLDVQVVRQDTWSGAGIKVLPFNSVTQTARHD